MRASFARVLQNFLLLLTKHFVFWWSSEGVANVEDAFWSAILTMFVEVSLL